MSLAEAINERDDATVWAHHLVAERVQPPVSLEMRELVQRCIHVYWELFAGQKVSACSVFGAIELLHRYCRTCASTHKFQRVGAACLWVAMKVAYGQDVPMCARLLCCHWNDVAPRRSTDKSHWQVKWRKVVGSEVHVLRKLQYDVLTVTAHDMFVLLLRLHRRGEEDTCYARAMQMLISMTLSPVDAPYLPSQVAVAVALTCGLQVDGRYLLMKWEETFAWVQRFVD